MKRIYMVSHGTERHLVNAGNRQQAISHIARKTIGCVVANQMDLVKCLEAGIKVQEASAETPEQLPIPEAAVFAQ
ncbi:MAG TPA: hypothetical protein PLL30_16850 [Candidatus Krumholzibacteria bacterium]|nr:hypothetical protein [Candidatus Krumholzibacteria bacterium]HPD73443.1 hypothetical protein [Candidatus Krumholzibacteria bacterium]HRY42165.1 hypothetical protein [Candidatus Krumholzibacteria bacterium]